MTEETIVVLIPTIMGSIVGAALWLKMGGIEASVKDICKQTDRHEERIHILEKREVCPLHEGLKEKVDESRVKIESLESAIH